MGRINRPITEVADWLPCIIELMRSAAEAVTHAKMKPARRDSFSLRFLIVRTPTACWTSATSFCSGVQWSGQHRGHVFCKAAQEKDNSDAQNSVEMLNRMLDATDRGGTLTGKVRM